MKLSILSVLVASAAAFAPATFQGRSGVEMSAIMDRRTAFAAASAAAVTAAMPMAAMADGAVSAATVNRARGIYGDRIAALKSAVAAGDFKAVAAEKNAFILFNSGAYPGAKNKDKKNSAITGTNAIFAAIRSGDKSALASAYDDYMKTNGISALPDVSTDGKSPGQGYSCDYDFRARTNAGAIYVR
eukprot:CAMPEP_0116048076 /NCGR_PEP_ID=MMETSP0321-20121206/29337_1 /TAXON_ID=163516 /ORGANISM="Leptocylindrus danicus var. danicus, Strain B650" /LENGTH=186 /DNA_ID=CAMNT_0003530209 /DNA_START=1028 /DNA_END=1588 /DNA_ORIENTATION=+